MPHKKTEGHSLLIRLLYQLAKDKLCLSKPIINRKPETKKNKAFPCTPKVAKDFDTFRYKGRKWLFVIINAAITFKKSRE